MAEFTEDTPCLLDVVLADALHDVLDAFETVDLAPDEQRVALERVVLPETVETVAVLVGQPLQHVPHFFGHAAVGVEQRQRRQDRHIEQSQHVEVECRVVGWNLLQIGTAIQQRRVAQPDQFVE